MAHIERKLLNLVSPRVRSGQEPFNGAHFAQFDPILKKVVLDDLAIERGLKRIAAIEISRLIEESRVRVMLVNELPEPDSVAAVCGKLLDINGQTVAAIMVDARRCETISFNSRKMQVGIAAEDLFNQMEGKGITDADLVKINRPDIRRALVLTSLRA